MSAKSTPKAKRGKRTERKIVPQFLLKLLDESKEQKSDPVVVERVIKDLVSSVSAIQKMDSPSRIIAIRRMANALNSLSSTLACVVFNREKKQPDSADLFAALAETPEKPQTADLFA